MTEQQQIAIDHHCRFGFETFHPQFRKVIAGGKASVILSVNSGYE